MDYLSVVYLHPGLPHAGKRYAELFEMVPKLIVTT